MFGNKQEPNDRLLRIVKLLRTKPSNQRELARRLGVAASTVLDDVTRAESRNVRLWEDERGNLHVFDPREI